jgi:hypothetical protein
MGFFSDADSWFLDSNGKMVYVYDVTMQLTLQCVLSSPLEVILELPPMRESLYRTFNIERNGGEPRATHRDRNSARAVTYCLGDSGGMICSLVEACLFGGARFLMLLEMDVSLCQIHNDVSISWR